MRSIKILSLISFIFFLFAACEKVEEQMPPPFMESFADVEECLSFPLMKSNQPGENQSCLFYKYDGDSILNITHYNAGFNCCPEKILTSFELRNDTIFITEDDSLQLCRCNCLFNVEFTIHNLPPGQYVITLNEPLVPLEEKKFIIDIDLEDVPMDQICQFRDFYPWRDD